jgi:Zn-dependent protease
MKLVRVLGIPVRVDPSSIVVFALVAWTLASGYFPSVLPGVRSFEAWLHGVAAAGTLLLCVILHELSHALVARRAGVAVRAITLHLLGGVSELDDEPPTPRAEAAIAIAGPLASFVIALAAFAARAGAVPGTSAWAYLGYVALANALLGGFNLVPAFPLDGGRVFHALLWAMTGGRDRATHLASRVASLVAMGLLAIGGMRGFAGDPIGGMWLMLIGLFLSSAARNSRELAIVRTRLERYSVADVMEPASGDAQAPSSSESAVRPDDSAWRAFVRLARSQTGRLAVVAGGRLVGVVDQASLRAAMARAASADEARRAA